MTKITVPCGSDGGRFNATFIALTPPVSCKNYIAWLKIFGIKKEYHPSIIICILPHQDILLINFISNAHPLVLNTRRRFGKIARINNLYPKIQTYITFV